MRVDRTLVIAAIAGLAGCPFDHPAGSDGRPARIDGDPTVIDARRIDADPAAPDAAIDAAVDAATAADCAINPAYTTVGGASYRQLASGADWLSGETSCEADGAHLVIFASNSEAAGLDSFIVGDAWIGVTDRVTGGMYRAVTAQPTVFLGGVSGDDGDPDVSCLRFKEGNDSIEVRDCGETNAVVCECDGQAVVPGSY